MSSDWTFVSLEELIEPETSITYGVVQPGEHDTDGVLFIRGGDIVNGQVQINQLRTITKSISEQYKRTILKGGELVVSLVGNPGQVAIVPASLAGANIARQVGLVRLDKSVDTRFVKYCLLSPQGQEALGAHSLGSVQKVINLRDLKTIKIPVPSLTEQREISNILGNFDDKIELNRQMNATLEAMARALFKAWFVDFEPVRANAENRPSESASPEIAKLFPSDFENGIPKGWRVGTLKDCCLRVESGGTPSRKVEKYWADGTIAWLTSSEVRKPIVLDAKEYISIDGYEHSNAKLWDKGTTIVAMYGATAGEVCLLANEMTANQACCGLIPKEGFRSFLFIKTFQSKQELANKSSGSAQQNLNQSIVANFQTIRPSEHCVKAFEQITGNLFERWIENEKENRKLTQIRDSLLPSLMSGKIRVGALEREISQAI